MTIFYQSTFSVTHLLKNGIFYCGSDDRHYVESNIGDLEKCIIFMYTKIRPEDEEVWN